jgi:hypothetical protein
LLLTCYTCREVLVRPSRPIVRTICSLLRVDTSITFSRSPRSPPSLHRWTLYSLLNCPGFFDIFILSVIAFQVSPHSLRRSLPAPPILLAVLSDLAVQWPFLFCCSHQLPFWTTDQLSHCCDFADFKHILQYFNKEVKAIPNHHHPGQNWSHIYHRHHCP